MWRCLSNVRLMTLSWSILQTYLSGSVYLFRVIQKVHHFSGSSVGLWYRPGWFLSRKLDNRLSPLVTHRVKVHPPYSCVPTSSSSGFSLPHWDFCLIYPKQMQDLQTARQKLTHTHLDNIYSLGGGKKLHNYRVNNQHQGTEFHLVFDLQRLWYTDKVSSWYLKINMKWLRYSIHWSVTCSEIYYFNRKSKHLLTCLLFLGSRLLLTSYASLNWVQHLRTTAKRTFPQNASQLFILPAYIFFLTPPTFTTRCSLSLRLLNHALQCTTKMVWTYSPRKVFVNITNLEVCSLLS